MATAASTQKRKTVLGRAGVLGLLAAAAAVGAFDEPERAIAPLLAPSGRAVRAQRRDDPAAIAAADAKRHRRKLRNLALQPAGRCALCFEPARFLEAELEDTSKPGDAWATHRFTGRKRAVCRRHRDAPWPVGA